MEACKQSVCFSMVAHVVSMFIMVRWLPMRPKLLYNERKKRLVRKPLRPRPSRTMLREIWTRPFQHWYGIYSSYFHYFINQTAKQSIFQGARVRFLRERACEAKEKENFSRLFPDSLFVLTLPPPSPQYFCLTAPAFLHYEKIRAVLQSIHFFRRLKV